jgi:predicted nucleotidyltransferase
MAEDPRRRATAFAERLASCCASALGDQFIAAILHGSLTLGDFTPGRSDVDLLVVVERPLADEEIQALLEAVEPLRAVAPSRVDLRVVTRAVAASPTPAPAMELYVALHPGHPAEIETRVAGEPDLAVEFSVVRAHGRSLVGPDPSAIVGAVPDAWVVAVGDRYLAAWEHLTDDAAHAELMVLTACRIWRFHAEGVHCAKSAAGRWALARDPSLTAVEAALRQRSGDPGATIGEDGIRRLLAIVRREIAQR